MRETRQEFEIQNETLKLQRFENTFFNILNLHHQIVSAIDYRYYKSKEKGGESLRVNEEKETVVLTGRDVFRFTYNSMYKTINDHPANFKTIYLNMYAQSQTDYGHYFRNLYRMIKLVDETDFFYNTSETPATEVFKIKYRYTSMIRAQLSDYELTWLFYNSLTENGFDKFKPLIEKYSLFKNLPTNLIPIKEHLELYDKRAYKQT